MKLLDPLRGRNDRQQTSPPTGVKTGEAIRESSASTSTTAKTSSSGFALLSQAQRTTTRRECCRSICHALATVNRPRRGCERSSSKGQDRFDRYTVVPHLCSFHFTRLGQRGTAFARSFSQKCEFKRFAGKGLHRSGTLCPIPGSSSQQNARTSRESSSDSWAMTVD